MLGKKPEEIKQYPQYPVLIFADGYSAMIIKIQPGGTDQVNREVWELIVEPLDGLS